MKEDHEPLEIVAKACARVLRDAAGYYATGSYIIVHYDEETEEITSDWLMCYSEKGPEKIKEKIKKYLKDIFTNSFFIEFTEDKDED